MSGQNYKRISSRYYYRKENIGEEEMMMIRHVKTRWNAQGYFKSVSWEDEALKEYFPNNKGYEMQTFTKVRVGLAWSFGSCVKQDLKLYTR